MKIKYYFAFYILCIFLLPGCGQQSRQEEIKTYIADLRIAAAKKNKEMNATTLQLPKPVHYKDKEYAGSNDRPANATTNPIQSYPIKALQFVGTLNQNNKMSAYVMAPDNMIYLVKVGDVIGDNYGKITKIDSDHIEISESYVKSGSEKAARIVTMELKD